MSYKFPPDTIPRTGERGVLRRVINGNGRQASTVYRGGFNCRKDQRFDWEGQCDVGIAAHEIGIVHYPGAQVAETKVLRCVRSDQCIFNCSWQASLKPRNGSGNPWSINCLIPENVAFSLA